jgi:flavoprotein
VVLLGVPSMFLAIHETVVTSDVCGTASGLVCYLCCCVSVQEGIVSGLPGREVYRRARGCTTSFFDDLVVYNNPACNVVLRLADCWIHDSQNDKALGSIP